MRLKHFLSVFLTLLTLSVGQMWGSKWTYSFSDTQSTGNKTWSNVAWTLAMDGGTTSTYSSTQGAHYGTNNSTCSSVTLSTSGISGTITSIEIDASRGSSLVGTLSVKVNNSAYTLSSGNEALTTSNATNVFTGDKSGNIEIKWTKSSGKGAFYIKNITIKYCVPPTALTNGTITSNTAHLSWTDSQNTNKYEVYVSTSSGTPAANATPSATVTNKYADITSGLTASTTYNWWVRAYDQTNSSKSAWVKGTSFTTTASGCTNSVALSKGSETNGTINSISSASVATCSGTASDRRVTVTITPAACYDAPTTLTWTKSSGTVTAAKQSGPTANGNGTYSYVYQFSQNDNGAGTFGVTCTAKPAGKTVNFDAGAGTYTGGSLTETCDGSGITLPSATASGICKGWTTFAGWATAPVTDSTTTSVTLYAAGSKYTPASDNMTLYAVYSKTKGTAESWDLISAVNDVTAGTYVITWENESYLPSETTAASNPVVGSGITQNNDKLTNTVTSAMQWTFTGDNTDGFTISHTAGNTTRYLGAYNNAQGITVAESTTSNTYFFTWTVSVHNTYGMLLKGGDAGSRYLALFTPNSGDPTWRYYAAGDSYKGKMRLYKKSGGSTTYYVSDPNCCTKLGQINGSFFWTTHFCPAWPEKHRSKGY